METAEKFYSLLFGQAAINESDAGWAAELCAKYPYCHAAHLLRARGVGTSQAPSANRSQLLFQIAAQVPSAVSVYRAVNGSLLPLTVELDDLLPSDAVSEASQPQETSAASTSPFSVENPQHQQHENPSDGEAYTTTTVAYSAPRETVATQEYAPSSPQVETEPKQDTQALDAHDAQEQAHDPSFATFYGGAGSGVQEGPESAENGAGMAGNAPVATGSFPSASQPSPASDPLASRSVDSVPPPPASSPVSPAAAPQGVDAHDAQEQAHDPSFAAFYGGAGSDGQGRAESAENGGKNGVIERDLANADPQPAAARGAGGDDSSMADSTEPTTVVMDWNALLGGSVRARSGQAKGGDSPTRRQDTGESASTGTIGAEAGEVDLRGVLDQSLATPVPEISASLFTLEGGAGTLSAEGYEYVRTQLNPLYRKAKQEGKDQMQRIESYLNNLDSLLETMREMAKKPADATEQQEDLARESSVLSRSIVSEHLADMHAEKGDFAIAITMYNRLAARNPEKSAYFAGKIEALRER